MSQSLYATPPLLSVEQVVVFYEQSILALRGVTQRKGHKPFLFFLYRRQHKFNLCQVFAVQQRARKVRINTCDK